MTTHAIEFVRATLAHNTVVQLPIETSFPCKRFIIRCKYVGRLSALDAPYAESSLISQALGAPNVIATFNSGFSYDAGVGGVNPYVMSGESVVSVDFDIPKNLQGNHNVSLKVTGAVTASIVCIFHMEFIK